MLIEVFHPIWLEEIDVPKMSHKVFVSKNIMTLPCAVARWTHVMPFLIRQKGKFIGPTQQNSEERTTPNYIYIVIIISVCALTMHSEEDTFGQFGVRFG